MLISLIGSGNVARALGTALQASGHQVIEIHSRNARSLAALSSLLKSRKVADIAKLSDRADLYILAVDDDAIKTVADTFPFIHKPVVHTSGMTPLHALKRFRTHGVFYPLNTFSSKKKSIAETPMLIEGTTKQLTRTLHALSAGMHCTPYEVTTESRKLIHLAAVFANNFTNALLTIASDLLKEKKIPFSILKPLLQSTVDNAFNGDPAQVQTGPAARGDRQTLSAHRKLLAQRPDALKLYRQFSLIIEKRKA